MKRLIISAIVSVVLNAAAFAVNLARWKADQRLPLAIHMHGGEITVSFGFGLRATHIYAMSADQVSTHSLHFDPISMILCLLIGIGVVYLALLIGGKVLKK